MARSSYKNEFLLKLTGNILLWICFNAGNIAAQSVSFEHYKVQDGLSQSEIICIFQDSEGFLWFGTQNGLNKFDGYSFEKFFRDPTDINTLSNNWIFSIAEDKEGNLLLGTKGGLNTFNKKTGSFSLIPHKPDTSPVQDNFVYGLAASGSTLYVNTPPVLTEIDLKNGLLKPYQNNSGYTGALYDRGSPVIVSQTGIVWAGTHNGLYAFSPQSGTFTDFVHNEKDKSSLSHNHITALFEDQHGNILVGTENGLNIIHSETYKISAYFHEDNTLSGLSHNFIRSVFRDTEGDIWVGTEGGGLNKMHLDAKTGDAKFEHFKSSTDLRYSVSHNIVYALYEDRSLNLWIGTIAGIDKADLKKKSISYYKRTDNPAFFDLPDNIIASVYKDKSGKIWIGSWGKGLFILDRNTRKIIQYNSDSTGLVNIPENHVHVIFEDSKSRIWIGTRNGVSVYNAPTGKFIPAHEYFQAPGFDCFDNIRVYCMMEDLKGQIWIGTGNGIRILDAGKKNVTFLKSEGESPVKISSNLVYSILEDNDREIWIATSEGLDRYLPENNTITHYLSSYINPNTICDNFTISLHKDNNQNIWIGTVSGLNRFNKNDSVFFYYSTKDGLPGNIIYDIIEDSKGNFWFSTGSGLAFSDNPAEGFQVVDELRDLEFNLKAVHRSTDGEMFFGGIEGLVSFYPDSLAVNNFIPPVRITSFVKERDGLRKKLNVYSGKIVLSHKDYAFRIEFSSLDYTYPERNRFVYKMEGISDRWIELGNQRFVHFTNLPAGNYIFSVKGTNNDGIWNEEETGIKIRINPPWWRSKNAYVLYIMLILFSVLMIIKIREKNLIREKRILEGKVEERTAEIALQKAKVEASEEKLSSVIRSLDDLVFVLDENGIFREFYNPGKRETHYRHPDLYIDKYFCEAGLPDPVTAKLKIIFHEIKQADDVRDFDYYLGSEDDRYWYNAKVSPRLNKKGELTGFVIVSRDISERKNAEQLLEQQKEDLKTLNATKDKFFSILAHDLKNPFAHLFSISEAVIRNYSGLEEEEKMLALKNIHKSAEFIYGLMENLLTWANVQRGSIEYTPEIFNLSRIIGMNINLFKIPAENKGIHLFTSVDDDIMAYGDREMINTVIRNLINNAVKFTGKGGSVTVEAEKKEKILEISVKDQGVGMSEEDLKKLFRIDVKFKSRGTAGETGTGLGLVLCSEFVEKNGGTIRCESKLNQGTTFYVRIPAEKGNGVT